LNAGTAAAPCRQAEHWRGYGEQGAAQLIRVGAAQAQSSDCGAAVVAVIDTAIDSGHPVLAGSLVAGYDFIAEQPLLTAEQAALEQSLRAILEQSLRAILEQSLRAILEQSLRAILEQSLRAILEQSNATVVAGGGEPLPLNGTMAPLFDPVLTGPLSGLELPPFFGHGTMVAGLVRLVAPEARIMPLRVFDDDGSGHLFDVVRAIYFAVDNGAEVINLSFGIDEPSPALLQAINYARQKGVVCVAAAGNDGGRERIYPAAFGTSLGVAATDLDDRLGDFSNYGSGLVSVAAPGVGVISAFPGGLFAAGWGTSFSTPLVSGTVALVRHRYAGGSSSASSQVEKAVTKSAVRLLELNGLIGSGRLDALGAVLEAELDP
ncbi:MAG: hypothetical protein D6696_12785, partial [Acidobacteria bacterium]